MESSHSVEQTADPFMPLVTVEHNQTLFHLVNSNVCWNSHASEHATARKIEYECGEHGVTIPGCRYFYAGHGLDRYGEVVFVYEPPDEINLCGSANPFDTGALFLGSMEPFAKKTTKKDRCQFIDMTKIDISSWRKEFGVFINRCYDGDVLSYLNGARPKEPDAWGNPNLPSKNAANTELCAWVWEIRIEEKHPIEQGLFAWSCPVDQHQFITRTINDMKGNVKPPKRAKNLGTFSKKWIRPGITETPCEAIQQRIIRLFSERKKPSS
ncbi:MAG: hypothetical protein HQL76_03615 [Magnetococcales bacterium]|nr:hypothetical protein [Magnetococcales bacterium]